MPSSLDADTVDEVTPEEALTLARAGALLLDVREPGEWAGGHIEGAVHQPLGGLDVNSLPTDLTIVTVCRSGNRSGQAAQQLAAASRRVYNLGGGLNRWIEEDRPLVTETGGPGSL